MKITFLLLVITTAISSCRIPTEYSVITSQTKHRFTAYGEKDRYKHGDKIFVRYTAVTDDVQYGDIVADSSAIECIVDYQY